MEQLITTLRRQGYKITPQRRAVVAALAAGDTALSAQQVLRAVQLSAPDVSLDTVYRNLDLLVGLGLITEIRLPGKEGNLFELVREHHHHHLICLGCGKTQCLDYCPVRDQDVAQAARQDFQIVSHSLDFYGFCRECRAIG